MFNRIVTADSQLRAHASYRARNRPIRYWRTTSGFEVDFILGDGEIAIEAKSTEAPATQHLKGLRAWREEHPRSRCIMACRGQRARRTEDGIEILPIAAFLRRLWAGDFDTE
jgi:uncharacterized protein